MLVIPCSATNSLAAQLLNTASFWVMCSASSDLHFSDVPWFVHNPNCHHQLGGRPTPMKNMKVNGKDDIPYIMENKKCIKMFQTTNK